MKNFKSSVAIFCSILFLWSCHNKKKPGPGVTIKTAIDSTYLPAPYTTESLKNISKVIGWPLDKTPVAPAGLTVSRFADSIDAPRWIYVAPSGDVFVSLANSDTEGFLNAGEPKKKGTDKTNSILIFRDGNGDGKPEIKKIFLKNLNRPFGMLILNDKFYVGNQDALWVYPYKAGQTEMTDSGKKILDLPAGEFNNHWTRNLIASRDGSKIYIAVGSGSNVAEHGIDNEKRRANILEINPDGSSEKVYASGLRNPVGMGWAPGTNTLWTTVNERDDLGDDLVPDFATSLKEGGFYGWPYSYYGANPDPRLKGERMDLVKQAIVPDIALGAHTASLGLTFNENNNLTPPYYGGMFIGQHGSWNRSILAGYKVVFLPFTNGKPSGPKQDFLTGFIANKDSSTVYGRPVCAAFAKDGALLVSDDKGDVIWRVTKK